MRIDIVRPGELTAQDIAAWSDLQRQAGLTSPFFSPFWSRACAEVDGPDGSRARVAVVSEALQPVAFLAARTSPFSAQAVGAPLCDYQGAVAHPDTALDLPAVVRALGVGRLDVQNLFPGQSAFAPPRPRPRRLAGDRHRPRL